MTAYDLVVIGGGPAGMAAALSAQESGVSRILLIERARVLGGILNQCVHSGFGLFIFGEELTGPQYAERFVDKIKNSGINILTDTSVISLQSNGVALLSGVNCGLLEVKAKAVILASGCRERPIGELPIVGTRTSGIFTAGMAQKMVNLGGYDIGRRFVILGSGDVGLIMARQLKLLGKDVLAVIEKAEKCGGLERNRVSCLEKYHIPLKTRCTVSRIHGIGRITGVTIQDLGSGGQEDFLACDTLITSVGLIPERELAEEVSDGGRLPDWLFLCGNACTVHDLVDDVTVEAEEIGRQSAHFILNGELPESVLISSGRQEEADSEWICIACPKACPLKKTETGFTGAACGRKDPVPSRRKSAGQKSKET